MKFPSRVALAKAIGISIKGLRHLELDGLKIKYVGKGKDWSVEVADDYLDHIALIREDRKKIASENRAQAARDLAARLAPERKDRREEVAREKEVKRLSGKIEGHSCGKSHRYGDRVSSTCSMDGETVWKLCRWCGEVWTEEVKP